MLHPETKQLIREHYGPPPFVEPERKPRPRTSLLSESVWSKRIANDTARQILDENADGLIAIFEHYHSKIPVIVAAAFDRWKERNYL